MQSSMPIARTKEVWTAKSSMTVVDIMRCTVPLHDHHTTQQQIAKVAAPKEMKV